MQRSWKVIAPAIAFAAPMLMAAQAHAGIGACGDIHVEAEAECEVKAGIECRAECEPIAFKAECAAELYVQCALPDQCSAELSAECSGSCMGECTGRCEVEPAQFDCRADCVANARAEAMARCGTGDNECIASAEATFEAECSASCNIDPGSIDCEAQCQASCEGSCTAEANVDCQIDCQSEGYVDCEAELTGGCEADCDADSALFCDGQYVDHGGNLEECVNSLRGLINARVEGYAEAECGNGKCEASAGGSVSCAVNPERGGFGAWWLFAGLGVAGLTFRRRRD